MPTTRRTSSGPRSSSQRDNKQPTLSFHNRVTKSGSKPGKKDLSTPPRSSPLRQQVKSDDLEVSEPEVQDVVVEEVEEAAALPEEKSEVEKKAQKISERQIASYWKKLESERKAKRVHQEDLSLAEKVLRYFDVSQQYGVSQFPAPLTRYFPAS